MAKIIKFWNPGPRTTFFFFYNLKIVCACANDAAPEICTNAEKWLVRKKHLLNVLGIALGLNFQN